MEITLKLINVGFFFVLLMWLLADICKWRRGSEETERIKHQESTIFNKITVLLNFIITISYLGYSSYEFWRHSTFVVDSVSAFLTWMLACAVAVYSYSRTIREHKRWPLVLILWWFFSCIFDFLLVSLYVLDKFKYLGLPKFLPKINIVDLASLPMLILISINALRNNSAKEYNDTEQPFLEKEVAYRSEEKGAYSSAGVWSKLTFMWLNPLFSRGHLYKLQLEHVPAVPKSETAAEAFSSLEESLRNQNTQKTSLSNAILHTIWRSLALNAAFAGNTSFYTICK